MRILFLTDDHLDYAADPLYLGLSRILGDEHVVDYPYKASFHESHHTPWYLVPRPGHRYGKEEILDRLRKKDFDIVCIASFRQNCLDELARLYPCVPFPPIVFIDGSDDARIRHELLDQYPIGVYFKRDYIWGLGSPLINRVKKIRAFRYDKRLFDRTEPMALSIVMDSLPDLGRLERGIDVSYRGRASHPRRAQAVGILSNMEDVKFSGGIYASPGDRMYKMRAGRWNRMWTKLFDNRLADEDSQQIRMKPETYYEEMATSKIAVSLRGGGATASLRYFEIVAMGAFLVSDAPETRIPNDFIPNLHAIYCGPDLSNLRKIVTHYLHEDEERESMAMRAREHLLEHHTCERRAEYFLNICRRTL